MANTLEFLLTFVRRFEAAGVSIWIFGGWAEELWQLTPARNHRDIDFLYPAANFEQLDRLITQMKDMQEISSKRFSHKRAIIFQDAMIEFLLVQRGQGSHFTDFFSGRYRLEWPADVFCHTLNCSGLEIQIASKQALRSYRQQHKQVELAYQNFLIAI